MMYKRFATLAIFIVLILSFTTVLYGQYTGTIRVGTIVLGNEPGGTAQYRQVITGPTIVGKVIKAAASQTADFIDLQNSASGNIFQFTSTASMVNGIQFNPGNTGVGSTIQSIGTDANISLILQSKGPTGFVNIGPNSTQVFSFQGVTSVTDGVTFTGASTANPATVSIAATGTDANINLNLVSKGTGIVQSNGVAIGSAAPQLTVITATGTYTTPAGAKAIWVRIVGGGGGGGSGVVTTLPANGGGAGAYSEKLISSPVASYSVTIGTGGTSTISGTASAFGSVITGVGGGSGGGSGGTAGTGGDINLVGGAGGSSSSAGAAPGNGGSTPFGGSGVGGGGSAAVNTGAGGGGGNGNGTSGSPGGTGAAGVCIVVAYF
jgi:hypothetical protein